MYTLVSSPPMTIYSGSVMCTFGQNVARILRAALGTSQLLTSSNFPACILLGVLNVSCVVNETCSVCFLSTRLSMQSSSIYTTVTALTHSNIPCLAAADSHTTTHTLATITEETTLLSDSIVFFVTSRLCKDLCYATNKECRGLTAASASLNKETDPSRLDIKRAWPRAVLE